MFKNLMYIISIVVCYISITHLWAADSSFVTIDDFKLEQSTLNTNGRKYSFFAPVRGLVTIKNTASTPIKVTLESEVIGELDTHYSLPKEQVILDAQEKKHVRVYFNYQPDRIYQLPMPTRIEKPQGGHTLAVFLKDEQGRIIDQATEVFAIETPQDIKESKTTITKEQAFQYRYSRYLNHPELRLQTLNSVFINIGNRAVTQALSALSSPSLNKIFYIIDLQPKDQNQTITLQTTQLYDGVYTMLLLDPKNPQGPTQRRVYPRVDKDLFTGYLPSFSHGAQLIIETGLTEPRYGGKNRDPVSLESLIEQGEALFGAYPSLMQDEHHHFIEDPAVFDLHQYSLRQSIWSALETQPIAKQTPLNPILLSQQNIVESASVDGVFKAYQQLKVSIQINEQERMNMWLLIPEGIGPFPAVVALHQTVAEGKDEIVGLGGYYHLLNYGPALASRGFVVIAPDSPLAGERYDHTLQNAYNTSLLERPQWSLIGQRARDHQRVVDYLQTLPFVNNQKISVIGHSLGGESAALLMALDTRISAGVISCPFTILQTLKETSVYVMPGHTILPLYMRPMLNLEVQKRPILPFDFDQILSLLAPRAVYFHDVDQELWDNAIQVAQALGRTQEIYDLYQQPEKLHIRYSHQPHSFGSWVQQEAFYWLEHWSK